LYISNFQFQVGTILVILSYGPALLDSFFPVLLLIFFSHQNCSGIPQAWFAFELIEFYLLMKN